MPMEEAARTAMWELRSDEEAVLVQKEQLWALHQVRAPATALEAHGKFNCRHVPPRPEYTRATSHSDAISAFLPSAPRAVGRSDLGNRCHPRPLDAPSRCCFPQRTVTSRARQQRCSSSSAVTADVSRRCRRLRDRLCVVTTAGATSAPARAYLVPRLQPPSPTHGHVKKSHLRAPPLSGDCDERAEDHSRAERASARGMHGRSSESLGCTAPHPAARRVRGTKPSTGCGGVGGFFVRSECPLPGRIARDPV